MAQHPMVSKPICFLAVFVGVFCACQKGHAPSGPIGDVVVRKAHVYTVDAKRLQAQAVAIKGDRILWVGDEKDVDAHIGPTTHVMDAGGRLLLPGFIDSHFHVLLGGNSDVLRIENGNTLAEVQRQVREFAIKGPELKWIEVEGWNYSAFPRGTLPTAKDLAGLTGGRPAFLVAYDYHTIWMNREALREFGITRTTRKVIFAEHVEKDPITAKPTGILTGFGSAGLSAEGLCSRQLVVTKHEEKAVEYALAAPDLGLTSSMLGAQNRPHSGVSASQFAHITCDLYSSCHPPFRSSPLFPYLEMPGRAQRKLVQILKDGNPELTAV